MNPDISRRQLVFLAVATEGGLALIACVLGWAFGLEPWNRLRVDAPALLWSVAITLPMLAGFFACVRWPIGPLGPIKQFVDRVVKPLFRQCSIFELALIAGLAGLGEEMLFRGVAQPYLIGWLGLWPGLLLASVLFGLVHAITPGYSVLASALGVYLGWCAHAFDNLTEVVIAHAVYDFVALVYLVRGESASKQ